jgi:hypothetical protein
MEEKFFEKICEFEQKTMPEIHQLGRERWFSPERLDNPNYKCLKPQYVNLENFYHFRIKQTELARVFVWTDGISNKVYILFIDTDWEMNH